MNYKKKKIDINKQNLKRDLYVKKNIAKFFLSIRDRYRFLFKKNIKLLIIIHTYLLTIYFDCNLSAMYFHCN